jgi:hypothetical protein
MAKITRAKIARARVKAEVIDGKMVAGNKIVHFVPPAPRKYFVNPYNPKTGAWLSEGQTINWFKFNKREEQKIIDNILKK